MADESKPTEEQLIAEGEAIVEIAQTVLAKFKPSDIAMDSLKKRFLVMGASIPATRTTLFAMAAFVGTQAYTAGLELDQLLGIVTEAFESSTKLPLAQQRRTSYLTNVAQAAAAKEAKAKSVEAFMAVGSSTVN